jgi:hypothetical protein
MSLGAIIAIVVGLVLAGTAAFGVTSVVGQSASEAQPVTQPLVQYGITSQS